MDAATVDRGAGGSRDEGGRAPAGQPGDTPSGSPDAPPSRASSALLAVGIVAAVALVAAGSLAVWARAGAAGAGRPGAVELAFGIEPGPLPPALPPEAAGLVVIGARALPAPPPGAPRCDLDPAGGSPTVLALPEAVLVLQEFGDGGRLRTCTLQPGSASISDQGGGDRVVLGSSCCTPEGFGMTESLVEAPQGARWALQDRGGWWVAYPVDGPRVHLLWVHPPERNPVLGPAGGGAGQVLFLDADGALIGETASG